MLELGIGSFWEWGVLIGSVAVASICKGGASIGAGLILLPTLSLIMDPFSALAVSVPLIFFMDIFAIVCHWKKWVEGSVLTSLIAGATVGVIIGIILVPYLSINVLKGAIGVVGVTYALSNLLHVKGLSYLLSRLPARCVEGNIPAYVGSTFGGLLNAINSGGALFAFSMLYLKLSGRAFVATGCVLFLVNDITKLIGFSLNGVMQFHLFVVSLTMLPVVVCFVWVGSRLTRHLSPERFRQMIFILILIMSGKTLCSVL